MKRMHNLKLSDGKISEISGYGIAGVGVPDATNPENMVYNGGLLVAPDGDVTVRNDLSVEGDLIINDPGNIVDDDGNAIKFGADQISSGSAISGQFLVANGSGGATWVTVSSANGQSF